MKSETQSTKSLGLRLALGAVAVLMLGGMTAVFIPFIQNGGLSQTNGTPAFKVNDQTVTEEDIKAFVIAHVDAGRDAAELCAWALERMAAFKVPRYVEFVEQFPRSAAKQEIQRSILKKLPHGAAFDREADANNRRKAASNSARTQAAG